MTVIKSEIGRRNANDTMFVVPPQPVATPGRNFFNRRHTLTRSLGGQIKQ
jgi:hypothetical protein